MKTMRIQLIALFATALAIPALAQDQDRDRTKDFGGDGLPEFLQAYDLNGDGVISEEERQAMREDLKQGRAQWMKRWDADQDGKINQQERDGILLHLRDQINAKREARFNEIAGAADDDGVVRLTLEEWIAAHPDKNVERLTAIFNMMDADGSGAVTFEEFLAKLAPTPPSPAPGPGPTGPGTPGGGNP